MYSLTGKVVTGPGLAPMTAEYRQVLDEGWQAHTSKYHRGTLLDPVTHEAVRKVDAEVSRRVSEHVRVFAAFQNLTGSRYQVSSTPVLTVGPPVLFRLGARVSLQ